MSLTAFHKEVIERMKDYPFYCTVACENYTEASSQSPYLADTMYIYAHAINRTLTADPVNGLSNGTAINDATEGIYAGYTGRVVIDDTGNRNPIYMLFGINKNEESEVFVVMQTYRNSTTWQPTYTDEATSIWAVRGGVRPLSKPKCGFTGAACVPTFLEAYFVYVTIAAIIFALMAALLTGIGIYTVRWKRKEHERLNRLWQINHVCLMKPIAKIDVAKSRRSLQSGVTSISTREMFDKFSETTSHAFYYLFDELVVAGKHTARPRIGEKEAAELRLMCQMDHENLNKFIGLCTDGPQYLSVWKFCSRGSLKDIIEKGLFTMDAFFIVSIILDICEGLIAIHRSPIGHHGHLTSSVCLVDERWLVKISNFGLSFLKQIEQRPEDTFLWTAPEHLRESNSVGSKAGDVYSFAIICSEIITRKSAFDNDDDNRNVEELVQKIKRRSPDPFRPEISTPDLQGIPLAMLHLIRSCWSENPEARPKIEKVKEILKSMHRGGNLMDHIFSMLEQYANNLEEEIEGRTRELVEEKKKSDILLQRMLPKQVAERLKLGQSVSPESFESVTIFFSDVVQFTNLASRCTPLQVVNLLNDLYTMFDTIIDEHNVYKVETIGDGYMCVSGLPHRNGNEHARDIAEMSFALLRTLNTFRVPHLPDEKINIRIGINTGPVVAGVVGLSMPRYCLFGDTVNTASRMESSGKPGHIHVSPETNRYLTEIIGGYRTESRGEVIIKGKGVMETFWLIPPEGLPSKVEPSQ
uniref:Guanylate cyclase n=1 Tax=Ascaris suum TaxID=6253 RepID=F1KWI0_ASCSU